MVRPLRPTDTPEPPVENDNFINGRIKMEARCERRGQSEVGIVTHDGHVFAALGSSVNGHNVSAYTQQHNGRISLTRWDGSTMLGCRSEVVRQYHDGSLAMMFRLTNNRFLIGYALGNDGMLFRGELITGCDIDRARHEALELADYWSEIDAEDEADDGDYPDR
jgi:hypothetical protein